MYIQIPRRHYQYLQLLVSSGCFSTEKEAILFCFEDGLHEAEFDATYAGEPDMDKTLLRGKPMIIEVEGEIEHLDERLEFIGKGYRIPKSKAATTAFLQGLFNQYLTLKGTALYRTSRQFRRKVNGMPHDLCYNPPGRVCMADLMSIGGGPWQGRSIGYCKSYDAYVVDTNLPGNSTGTIRLGDVTYRCLDCYYLRSGRNLPYCDVAEAAAMLGISSSTVRKLIRTGDLEVLIVERSPQLNAGEFIAPRKYFLKTEALYAYRKRHEIRAKAGRTRKLTSTGT